MDISKLTDEQFIEWLRGRCGGIGATLTADTMTRLLRLAEDGLRFGREMDRQRGEFEASLTA